MITSFQDFPCNLTWRWENFGLLIWRNCFLYPPKTEALSPLTWSSGDKTSDRYMSARRHASGMAPLFSAESSVTIPRTGVKALVHGILIWVR